VVVGLLQMRQPQKAPTDGGTPQLPSSSPVPARRQHQQHNQRTTQEMELSLPLRPAFPPRA